MIFPNFSFDESSFVHCDFHFYTINFSITFDVNWNGNEPYSKWVVA